MVRDSQTVGVLRLPHVGQATLGELTSLPLVSSDKSSNK